MLSWAQRGGSQKPKIAAIRSEGFVLVSRRLWDDAVRGAVRGAGWTSAGATNWRVKPVAYEAPFCIPSW